MPGIAGGVMMVLFGLLYTLVPLAAVVFFGWLGLRFVRTRERESLARGGTTARDELMRLEEQVQSLQSEVQSLHERQAFMEKLLERPKESP